MSSVETTFSQASTDFSGTPTWKVKLLYDGACPLCLREVNFLARRDAGRGLVAFTDIAANEYNPSDNGDIDFETAMGRIHAITADGEILRNVAVFHYVYTVLGLGWVYVATQWPIIGPIIDRIYEFWADRRLALTGRPQLQAVIQEREQRLQRCRLEE